MLIDVVIPSYKPDEKFIAILQMLYKQTKPVNKIIVMNTGKEYFPELPQENYTKNVEVYHISEDEFDHGKTRNEGLSHSKADAVLFMTQDAVPVDITLIEAIDNALLSADDVAVAYARQMARDDSSLAEKFSRGFNYPDESRIKGLEDIDSLGIKTFFCSDVCAAYKREIFINLGGFVNETVINEDMIFANKLIKNGYKIFYCSEARVYHTHEYSGMQQFRRNFDLAVSQKMHPEVFDGISSESEGVKYVKAAAKYFAANKRPFDIFPFVVNCGFKYLGYRKGKNFENLTREKILFCTSNKGFFTKYFASKGE